LFRQTMEAAGLRVPRSAIVTRMAEAERALGTVGLPAILRPGFTMGGQGGGVAHTESEFREKVAEGLAASPIGQVLVEESVTGWSNIQFAVNPETDEIVVIEMNPRVSRSSALASKATGFPIAKIAARLAVGYALEEIDNDITKRTPASFEPTIDYVVVKWPRFAFEKFPGAEGRLSTHMQSVGEAMAIGRTFKQAFAKAMRSRELDVTPDAPEDDAELLE